ncbi:Two-component response regulator ORR29 [Dichanthelium oligosanthes]|uniref:Two-component response regulator ORR29 n=1 Tax=Dichanthelium oligosanthes TaxID=888268 RepID=A0A1E5UV52_9POAL|nr:Two-component response regulator ORR29 [Dichanthelium oligosanthes]
MGERAMVCPTDDGLRVIVVDEDEHHANSARSMLCAHDYRATAYTSPLQALDLLEGHAQEVDVALVALHMEEMHGFQFLDMLIICAEFGTVMSEETTMDIIGRCVKLGARFLVGKPIDTHTVQNLWQHLELEDSRRMHHIKQLLQGNGEAHDMSYMKESTKTKKSYICWNEYLQGKFLRALEILGDEDLSPRNIEILMNVEGVNRKHVASHLQKYRKRMEAGKQNSALDAMKCGKRASTSKSAKSHQEDTNTSLSSPDIQQEEITADEDVPHAQTGSFSDDNVHAAMRRSIQFGTIYDESQYFDFSYGDGVDMMEHGAAQDDGKSASGFRAQIWAGTGGQDGRLWQLRGEERKHQMRGRQGDGRSEWQRKGERDQSLKHMGTQRSDRRLSVLVVDDNLSDANIASCMLAKLNFQASRNLSFERSFPTVLCLKKIINVSLVFLVTVYTSSVEALKFLKDHEKDIDFALVAVNMKEMHGFQFLDISKRSHKNLQVISIEGKSDHIFKSENKFGEFTNKQKATQLMWTPSLERKFLQARELLGEAATPKMIQLSMNVNSIGRTQISAHLQKYRKKVKKELRNTNAKKCSNGASSSKPLQICETGPNTCQYDPEIQPADTSDEDMSWDQTESTEATRRALQLGTVFDESQLPNDPSGRQASKGEVDMMGDDNCPNDWTYAFGDKNVVSETHNADNGKGVMDQGDSDKQVSNCDAQARVVKLVTYSDSEDDEAL